MMRFFLTAACIFLNVAAHAAEVIPLTDTELQVMVDGHQLLPTSTVKEQTFKAVPLKTALSSLLAAEKITVVDGSGLGARTKVTMWNQSGSLAVLTDKLCAQAGALCQFDGEKSLKILARTTLVIPLPDLFIGRESLVSTRQQLAKRVQNIAGVAPRYDALENSFLLEGSAKTYSALVSLLRPMRQKLEVVQYDTTVLALTPDKAEMRLPWQELSPAAGNAGVQVFVPSTAKNAADVEEFLSAFGTVEVAQQQSLSSLAGENLNSVWNKQSLTLKNRADSLSITLTGQKPVNLRLKTGQIAVVRLPKAVNGGKPAVQVIQRVVYLFEGQESLGAPSLAAAVQQQLEQAQQPEKPLPKKDISLSGTFAPITKPLKKMIAAVTESDAPAPVIYRPNSNGKMVSKTIPATPVVAPPPNMAVVNGAPPPPSALPIIVPSNARPEDLELIREMQAMPEEIPMAAATMPISTAADTAAGVLPPPPAPAPVQQTQTGGMQMVMVPAAAAPVMSAPALPPSGKPKTLGALKAQLGAAAAPMNTLAQPVMVPMMVPAPSSAPPTPVAANEDYTDTPTRGKWLSIKK